MRKIRAILSREFLATLRNGWSMVSLGLILTVVSVAFCVAWASMAGSWNFSERALMSRVIFYVLSIALFSLMSAIAPIMNASAICRERETKTLDLLLCTGIPRTTILLAKWASATGFQVLLILLLAPLLALSFQLGGVGLDEYLFAFIMILQAVMVYGMIGLAISCWARKSVPAMMGSLTLVMMLTVGWPMGVAMIGEILRLNSIYSAFDDPSSAIYAISPIAAGISVSKSLMSATTFDLAGTLDAMRPHLTAQAATFILFLLIAFRGIQRSRTPHSATAPKLIDDPALLRRRSRRFPYYLIDPLKRAQDIGDTQNPAYVKENRTGGLSRLTTLIRIGYLGAFLSIFAGFATMGSGTAESLRGIALAGASFVLIFVPVLCATSISREREENTFDLLRITLLDPRRIAVGKFLSSCRLLVFILVGITFVPVGIQGLLAVIAPRSFVAESPWMWARTLALLAPLCVSYCAFYASVGLLMSSISSRSILAILLTYVGGGLILIMPGVLEVAGDIYGWAKESKFLPEWFFIVGDDIVEPVARVPLLLSWMLSAPAWLSLNHYGSWGLPKWLGSPGGLFWSLGATAANLAACRICLHLSAFYLRRMGRR